MRWAIVVMGVSTCVSLGGLARVASAQPTAAEMRDWGRAELEYTEIVPRSGPLLSLHAGFHGDVAGMLELRAGWGVGKATERLLFPVTRMWRFSLAARGAYGRHDSLALSLLAGRSQITTLGFSLEGGLDARVIGEGDTAYGPIVSLGIRSGALGLHTNVWTHFLESDRDWGISIAVGYNLGDSIGSMDVAKKRAKKKLKGFLPAGVPLP